MAKKSRRAPRQLGDNSRKKSSPTSTPPRRQESRRVTSPLGRWARNGETARYCNVSKMTLWRWKHERHYRFPPAAKINKLEFNDLDEVDRWLQAHIPAKGARR